MILLTYVLVFRSQLQYFIESIIDIVLFSVHPETEPVKPVLICISLLFKMSRLQQEEESFSRNTHVHQRLLLLFSLLT